MSFVLQTNSIPLFAETGDFHAEAVLNYSVNKEARTFTVNIEGVRGYCKYGWNFRQNIEMWLGTSNSGADKESKTGTIASSGSNSYRGWLPANSYASIQLSKTYNYNDDGSVPQVWFYLRDYNQSVHWINANKRTPVNVEYFANISSYIETIERKDDTSPTLGLVQTAVVGESVYWQCSSDSPITSWYSNTPGWNYAVNVENTVLTDSTWIGYNKVYLQLNGVKKSNQKIGTSNILTIDNELPKLSNISLIPESNRTGRLNFNSSHPIDFRIKYPNNTYSGWYNNYNQNISISISILENINDRYEIEARRINTYDQTWLNNLTTRGYVYCDSCIPQIHNICVSPTSSNHGDISFTTSHPVDFRIKYPNNTYSGWYKIGSNVVYKNIELIHSSSNNYILEVRRSGTGSDVWKNNLINNATFYADTRLPLISDLIVSNINKRSATLEFKHNNPFNISYNFKFLDQVIISNKQVVGNSVNDTFLNGRNIYSNNYVLTVFRTDNSRLFQKYSLTIDDRFPIIDIFELVPTSRNSAKLYIKLSINQPDIKVENFKYRITWPNDQISSWEDVKLDNYELYRNITCQDNINGEYTLELERKDYPKLNNTASTYCDTRVPSNIAFNIFATAIDKAAMTYKCELDTDITLHCLDNDKIHFQEKNILADTKKLFSNVPVLQDRISKYRLEVVHTKNQLSAYSDIRECDTRIPKINLEEINETTDISGCEVKLYIKCDLKCSNFIVNYRNVSMDTEWNHLEICKPDHPLNVAFEICKLSDLEPGDKYEVSVEGKRAVTYDLEHSLIGTSNIRSFIAKGGCNIVSGVGRPYKSATIYLCRPSKHGGENMWEAISPYILYGYDDMDEPIWKRLK